MKTGTVNTNQISTFLTGRKINPAGRMEFYGLCTRFAQEFSRLCVKEGFHVSADPIYKSVTEFILDSKSWEKINSLRLRDNLADKLHKDIFSERSDFNKGKVRTLFAETHFATKLFDWAAVQNFINLDLVSTAKDLARDGETDSAIAYYREAVARFERREGSMADYLEALQGLCRIDPDNQGWIEKLKGEEEKLQKLTQSAAAPEIFLAPEAQREVWGKIKKICRNLLKEDDPNHALFSIYARLAEEKDKDEIRKVLNKHIKYDQDRKICKEQLLLLDTYIKYMTPGDFQKVIAALDDQRRGSISFALALVQRIKTREVIPQLVQFFKKGGGDSVWWANRDILLNDLFDHNDLPFLYELLNHQEDLQNFATIARQYGLGEAGEDYLRSLARDGLLKVLGPKDSDDLLLRLEKASGFSLATLLLGLEKIGSRDDIQIAGEYLGREEDIAYAAAKVIATHATHEDIGLLSGMERHVFPGVRMEAMRAHLRLRTALSMPAVVKIFNNAPYDSDDKNVRGEKEELKDLVLSHAIAEDIEALAGLDHKFSEVEELMSELKKRFGRKRGADPTVEHANLWTGDCKAEQFVPLVKEEDLIDDRFNLRRMLFDPSDAVFKAAVEIIIKYQPTGCFNDLLEAYKFGVEYIQNRSGLIRAYHLKDVLFAVASQDDLPQIEQMLEPDFPKKWDRVEEENEKLLALGISLISKLRAWQLIPKITPLANDGNIEAKLCMFGFAEDIKDWSAAVDYLGDREPAVAQKAVEVLINISTPEKLSNFKEMLTSSGTPYQYAAAEVLAAMLQVKDLPQQEEDPVPNGTGLGYNTYSPPTKISQMLDEIKKLLENTADVHRISALLNVVNVLDIQLSDSQVRRLIEICNNWHGPITKKVLALAAKRGASKYLPAVLKMVDAQEWRLVSDYLDQIVEIYRTVGLPKIRKQLRSKSAKRRAVAVAALGEYGEQSDVARVEKILLKNIKDDRVSARAYSRMAARGLDMGDVRGKMLQASGSARYAYAKAFVMQASKDDAVLIRRMLTDQKEYLRAAGIEAATRLGMADLLPTIRARLQDRGGFLSDPPKSVLLPAVAFVKELGGREDLDLVKGAVGRGIERADEAFLAHATEEDLEKAREWTKKDEDFNHNPRFVLLGIRLFVKFNQTEAIPIIKYWLKRGSHIDGFTKTLIEALVQLSPKEDKEYLIKLAEAARVSLKAVIAGLTTWFEESDIEKYRDAILKGDNLSLVYLAVLSKKAPEVALEVSRQRLKELTTPSGYFYPWDSLSKYVKCLGELGDEQDLPMLFIQLSHSNAGTASDAAKAFGKILPRVAKTKT